MSERRTLSALSGAWLRGLYNSALRRSGRRRGWVVAAAVGAVALWLMVFLSVRTGTAFMLERLPFAGVLLPKIMEVLLHLLLWTLAYSTTLVALVNLYLSDDLRFLGVLPARNTTLFFVKALEVGAVSTWMPVVFGVAVLSAIGAGAGAGLLYYPLAVAALLLFAAIPIALSMALTSVAVNVFPANRTRDVLIFLSLVVLLAIFVLVRSARPERLLDPGVMEELAAQVAAMELPGLSILPSAWMAAALSPMLGAQPAPPSWGHLGALAGAALVSVGLGAASFQVFFRRGLSRSLGGRGRAMAGEGTAARLLERLTASLPLPMGAIARKDLLQFGRDPAQWSQLVLLAALVFIYQLNVAALPLDQIENLGIDRADAANGLAFLNLAFVGFVLTAVSLRFLFSAVSLEGGSAWVVLSCPVSYRRLLWAKLVPGLPLLWGFGLLLVGGSNLILDPSPGIAILTVLAMSVMTASLAGLGVGLGAVMPRFEAQSPTRIAASVGGLLYMAGGLAYTIALGLVLAGPAFVLAVGERLGTPGPVHAAIVLIGAVLALGGSAAVFWIPIEHGARALERGTQAE